MLNVVLVAPEAMDTEDETRATSMSLLESVTLAPLDGAGSVNLMVATVRPWLVTVDGLKVTEVIGPGGGTGVGVGVGVGVGAGVGAGAGVGVVSDTGSRLQPAAASAVTTTVKATDR